MGRSALSVIRGVCGRSGYSDEDRFVRGTVVFCVNCLSSGSGDRCLPGVLASALGSVITRDSGQVGEVVFGLTIRLTVAVGIITTARGVSGRLLGGLHNRYMGRIGELGNSFSLSSTCG